MLRRHDRLIRLLQKLQNSRIILINQELGMKACGLEVFVMEKVKCYGKMELHMMEIGTRVLLMAKEK